MYKRQKLLFITYFYWVWIRETCCIYGLMKFHTMGCFNNAMPDRNKQFITADWERIIMVNALVIKKRNEFMHPRTIPPATPVYAPWRHWQRYKLKTSLISSISSNILILCTMGFRYARLSSILMDSLLEDKFSVFKIPWIFLNALDPPLTSHFWLFAWRGPHLYVFFTCQVNDEEIEQGEGEKPARRREGVCECAGFIN